MSCDQCVRVQDRGEGVYPFRVGNGTVLIQACEEHAEQLMDGYKE